MNEFIYKIKKMNKKVHLETSGAYKLTGYWDWICLSPKKRKLPITNKHLKLNTKKYN